MEKEGRVRGVEGIASSLFNFLLLARKCIFGDT